MSNTAEQGMKLFVLGFILNTVFEKFQVIRFMGSFVKIGAIWWYT
jgi:hypothetical protein